MKGRIIFETYDGKIIEITELKFKFKKSIDSLYQKVSEPGYSLEGLCIAENIKKVIFKNCTFSSKYKIRFSCENNDTIIELDNCNFYINSLNFSYNAVKINNGYLKEYLNIRVTETPYLEISNFGKTESPRFELHVRKVNNVNLKNIENLNRIIMNQVDEVNISNSFISNLYSMEIKAKTLNMEHVYLNGSWIELFYEEKNIQDTVLETDRGSKIKLPFATYLRKTYEPLIVDDKIINSELEQARINFLSQLKALRNSINDMAENNKKIISSAINSDMGIEILKVRRRAKQNIDAVNESQQKRKVKSFKIKNDTNVLNS